MADSTRLAPSALRPARLPFGLSRPPAQANPLEAFAAWQKVHRREPYKSATEAAQRLDAFVANARLVAQTNAAADAAPDDASSPPLRLALNQFADLTFEEFAATRLGYNAAAGAASAEG